MKTSKEMQLRILDKMRENVESDKPLYLDIQGLVDGNEWRDDIGFIVDFEFSEYRIKPSTITINGVEIPKPLSESEILGNKIYCYVCNNKSLHGGEFGNLIQDKGIRFVYKTKEEAIEASKLLFGIKE